MEAWREELYHYGAKGMHWGTRHWQNEDGTFNAAGKERYFGRGTGENYHKIKKVATSINNQAKKLNNQAVKLNNQAKSLQLTDKQKKIAKAALTTLAVAAVAGGTVYMAKTGKLDGVIAKGKQATSEMSNLIRSQKVNPHGFVDADIVKNTIKDADAKAMLLDTKKAFGINKVRAAMINAESKRHIDSTYKRLINDLSDKEIASVNSGEKTLHDFYKDRFAKGFYSSKSPNNSISNLVDQVSNKAKEAVATGKNLSTNARKVATQAGKGIKTIAKETGDNAKTAYKKVTSAAKSSGKAAKSGASIIKVLSENPEVAKAGINYASKKINDSKANSAVKKYKKEHPDTKMTDAEIARNLGYSNG